jgi:pyrroloquinoline quinone (PQQ) biosynthesis protein C
MNTQAAYTGAHEETSILIKMLVNPSFEILMEMDGHNIFEVVDARALAHAAFVDGDAEAQLHTHQLLYSLYSAYLAPPWEHRAVDPQHHSLFQLRQTIEDVWDQVEHRRLASYFDPMPVASDFPKWAATQVARHCSNVSHPLFDFLSDHATYQQLREFIVQETPFDIFFGDILAMMMPGIYGPMKAEFSRNFWDEMGRGDAGQIHRQLRINMMEELDIPVDIHLTEIGRFCVEELQLANMYFHGVVNRRRLPQAIGMMLATELMVPGRLDRQIAGWRRVGLSEQALHYLLEHTVVDIEHAHGWVEQVAVPLVHIHPELIPEIALGLVRRLDYAGIVCDRMLSLLPSI